VNLIRTKWSLAALALLAGEAMPGGALAQSIELEARVGLGIGSESSTLAGLEMSPVSNYGAMVLVGAAPSIHVFAGVMRIQFGCGSGYCDGIDPVIGGSYYSGGFEYRLGPWWARSGLTYGTTEIGDDDEWAEPGMGVMAGFGRTLGSGTFRITPGIVLSRMNSPQTSGDDRSAFAISVGAGVSMGFGF